MGGGGKGKTGQVLKPPPILESLKHQKKDYICVYD